MIEILRKFNGDVATKEALKQYATDFIAEEGVRLMFSKADVSHIADAKILIDKIFDQISIDYAIPDKKPEQTNPSR